MIKEISHHFYEKTRSYDISSLTDEQKKFFSSITESVTKCIFLASMQKIRVSKL